jgi:hypothetical protein
MNTITDNQSQEVEKMTPAEKLYKSHLKNVSEYQKRNPEKMREKCKKYNDKIKADPEKLEELRRKKREYYINVIKPKKEAEKLNK